MENSISDQGCPEDLLEGATQNDSRELFFVGAYDHIPNYVWESKNISTSSRKRPRKYLKRRNKCSGQGILVDFPMPTTSSTQHSNADRMVTTECLNDPNIGLEMAEQHPVSSIPRENIVHSFQFIERHMFYDHMMHSEESSKFLSIFT